MTKRFHHDTVDAGTVLHRGTNAGTSKEWIRATLLAGTYYVRVEAREVARLQAEANTIVFVNNDPGEVVLS